MLDNIDALSALARHKTMLRAAKALHITQSAVSKRIANLEHQVGKELIERQGRYVALTPDGARLLDRARPLIGELKELFLEERAEMMGELVIDIAGSILIGWGASSLAKVQDKLPGVSLKVNAIHASLAVERVRAGESMLALVQGTGRIASDLVALPIIDQRICIVPSALENFSLSRRKKAVEVIGIEAYTEAWQHIQSALREGHKSWGFKIEKVTALQSFSAITQMARAGFGHGLVPEAVAVALGVPKKKLIQFPKPGVTVPISLIGRKSTLGRPIVQTFHEALMKSLPVVG